MIKKKLLKPVCHCPQYLKHLMLCCHIQWKVFLQKNLSKHYNQMNINKMCLLVILNSVCVCTFYCPNIYFFPTGLEHSTKWIWRFINHMTFIINYYYHRHCGHHIAKGALQPVLYEIETFDKKSCTGPAVWKKRPCSSAWRNSNEIFLEKSWNIWPICADAEEEHESVQQPSTQTKTKKTEPRPRKLRGGHMRLGVCHRHRTK